ncbi:MAG: response regulator [Bacteroidota bacterium]|nr:response regulator [Bacteroidota bacterium]
METPSNGDLFVLLADDDADDRMFFEDAVEEIELKINLLTVKDGQELISFLERDTVMLPQVLFLDLNMPFKNGLQCLHEIRSNASLNDICIVLYSTTARQTDIDEGFDRGANFFIHKPSSFTDLKKILSKLFTQDLRTCMKPNKNGFLFKL